MSFSQSIKSLFSNTFKMSGRATRSEYWFSYLFTFLVSVAIYLVMMVALVGGMAGAVGGSTGAAGAGFATVAIAYVVLLIWALYIFISFSISMTVRRLHDTNRSGWWWWLHLVPFGIIVVFIFTVMPSSPGENNYG